MWWARGAWMDKRGVLLLYDSEDGFRWRFVSILAENDGRFGLMWECPDFFPLDGKDVLFVSPQDMLPEGFEYHNGNGTVCQIGTFDEETKHFIPEHNQAIDYGIDFYAPQTLLTPDGRRVMIGWMQNWETSSCKKQECIHQCCIGNILTPEKNNHGYGCITQDKKSIGQYRTVQKAAL